jgi:uncharacterized protein (TIGR02145 family)
MPPGAGTKTWTCSSQTWSGPVRVADCDHNAFTNDDTAPHCRSYTYNSIKYFYYNWTYLDQNKNILCPSPWHVPTNSEFSTLISCLGSSGANGKYYPESSTWGGALAGNANGSSMHNDGSHGYYWSSMDFNADGAYCMDVSTSTASTNGSNKYAGLQVRCIL